MKILVLSDSHSSLRYMMDCVDVLQPDAMIHLGDYYDDGETLHEKYPDIPFFQVPGNCDCYRCSPGIPQIRVEDIFGVKLYLTHGHRHDVKQTMTRLLHDAKDCGVQGVLYGHTHVADCRQDDSGMWILNPGSCGYGDRSAGLIETENGCIVSCWILRQRDLEAMG